MSYRSLSPSHFHEDLPLYIGPAAGAELAHADREGGHLWRHPGDRRGQLPGALAELLHGAHGHGVADLPAPGGPGGLRAGGGGEAVALGGQVIKATFQASWQPLERCRKEIAIIFVPQNTASTIEDLAT